MQLTPCIDGNHFITSRDSGSYNGNNFDEYLLVKVNDFDDTIWTERFGNMAHVSNYVLRASKSTSDAGLVVVFNAYEDTITTPLIIYMQIYKFVKNGVLQWNSYFRFYSLIIGVGINEDSEHNIIVEGMTLESPGFGIVLFKLDSAGSTLWYRTYYPDFSQCYNLGSGIYQPVLDYMLLVKLVSDPNGISFFRTDTVGNILSAKSVISPYYIGYFNSSQLADGSILAFGSYGTFPGRLFIEKFDGNANFLWGKIYPAIQNYTQNYVYESSDGTLMAVGYMRDTTVTTSNKWKIYQMKLDTSGNILWAKNIPVYMDPFFLYFKAGQSADKGTVLAGSYADTSITPASGGSLIIKTDSLGNSCVGSNPLIVNSVSFSAYDSLLTYTEYFYQYDNILQTPQVDAGM